MSTLITDGTLLTEQGPERLELLVEGKRIRKISKKIPRKGARVLSAKGCLVSPGLIDLQINGGFGKDFGAASADEILELAKRMLEFGVTGFLPTLVSETHESLRAAIAAIREAMGRAGGAKILGIHLEGPYLNPVRRGAHREEFLRTPSMSEFRDLLSAADGAVRMSTIAPELPGAMGLIREGAEEGVVMAAGHSSATAPQITEAKKAGLKHVTHVYNAMAPFHHRDESILNAALDQDDLTCSLIYDRHHVTAGAAKLLLRAKPAGTVALVSDATSSLVVTDGSHPVEKEGTLAGGSVSVLDGVRNLAEDLGLAPERALALASTVPARILGLRSALREGAVADLVLLGRKLDVRAALVDGEVRLER